MVLVQHLDVILIKFDTVGICANGSVYRNGYMICTNY